MSFLLLAIFLAAFQPGRPEIGDVVTGICQWELVWQDEFDGGLDTQRN